MSGHIGSGSPGTPSSPANPSSPSAPGGIGRSNLLHHRLLSNDGFEISVYERRPERIVAGAKPILLLHSATFSSLPEYDLQVEGYSLMKYLAGKGYDVFAVDIRGYGNSQKPSPEVWITADLAIRDVHTAVVFIQQLLGVESVNILGWSWGTQVGGLFAQSYPHLVDKLILYAPFWRGINAEIPEPETTRRENTRQDVIGDFLDMSYVDPQMIEEFVRQCTRYDRTSPLGSWRDLRNLAARPILDPRRIAIPTLIIYGEYDHLIVRSDIQEFYSLLGTREKKLTVVPNADHMTHLGRSHTIFQKMVNEFLKVSSSISISEIVATGNNSDYEKFVSLYLKAFPSRERRNASQQMELIKSNPAYHCWAVYKGHRFVGFITTWDLGEATFIEHMAVDGKLRNHGYGSAMLSQFLKDKLVILEVERPGDTAVAGRRIGFYKRLGFVLNGGYKYLQPPYSPNKRPVPMFIMSYPRALRPREFQKIKSVIYERVYSVVTRKKR